MTESIGIIEDMLTPANVVNYFSVGVGILSVAGSFYLAKNLKPTETRKARDVIVALAPAIIGIAISVKMITKKD